MLYQFLRPSPGARRTSRSRRAVAGKKTRHPNYLITCGPPQQQERPSWKSRPWWWCGLAKHFAAWTLARVVQLLLRTTVHQLPPIRPPQSTSTLHALGSFAKADCQTAAALAPSHAPAPILYSNIQHPHESPPLDSSFFTLSLSAAVLLAARARFLQPRYFGLP